MAIPGHRVENSESLSGPENVEESGVKDVLLSTIEVNSARGCECLLSKESQY